jgi:hypothetical protein
VTRDKTHLQDALSLANRSRSTSRASRSSSGRELAAEIATDVLIIEDETFIAMDIEALVRRHGPPHCADLHRIRSDEEDAA